MKLFENEHRLLLIGAVFGLLLSGLHPFDRNTWVLEVFPVFIGLGVLWATHRRFRPTPLLYRLLGTQGDPWDTQWDMFLALTGAVTALISLSDRHDKELLAISIPGGAK